MCQLLNRGSLVTGAKVFTDGSGVIIGTLRWGLGWLRNRELKVKVGGGISLEFSVGVPSCSLNPDLISDKGFPYVTSIFRHGFY